MFIGLEEPSPDRKTPLSKAKTVNSLHPFHPPLTSRPKSPFFTENLWTGCRRWAALMEISLFYLFFSPIEAQRRPAQAGKPDFRQKISHFLRTLAISRSLLVAREPGERLWPPASSRGTRVLAEKLEFFLVLARPLYFWHCCHAPRGSSMISLCPILPFGPSFGQELEDEPRT